MHLEKVVGNGNPVGIALDGYPIYGYSDPDGSAPKDLDWLNGHTDDNGQYHDHATKTYPYLNGGFYGEVTERGGQVDPQPRAQGVRPAQPPLLGAKIIDYGSPSKSRHVVTYEVFGKKRSVDYTIADNGSVEFRFEPSAGTRTENYTPRRRGGDRLPGAEDGPQRDGNQSSSGDTVGPADRPRDPLVALLDVNGDAAIDGAELRRASNALRSLDHNHDGTLSLEDLRNSEQSRRMSLLPDLRLDPLPDASPEYFDRFAEVLSRSLRCSVVVEAPLRRLKKGEIVKSMRQHVMPLTFSCINPDQGLHCGRCKKCDLRNRAFADGSSVVPTSYSTQSDAPDAESSPISNVL